MRVLVAGFDDLAGQRQLLRRVVLAPAVVGERGAGQRSGGDVARAGVSMGFRPPAWRAPCDRDGLCRQRPENSTRAPKIGAMRRLAVLCSHRRRLRLRRRPRRRCASPRRWPLPAHELPYPGAQPATHRLQLDLFTFTDTSWQPERIVAAVREAAPLLAQCGIAARARRALQPGGRQPAVPLPVDAGGPRAGAEDAAGEAGGVLRARHAPPAGLRRGGVRPRQHRNATRARGHRLDHRLHPRPADRARARARARTDGLGRALATRRGT